MGEKKGGILSTNVGCCGPILLLGCLTVGGCFVWVSQLPKPPAGSQPASKIPELHAGDRVLIANGFNSAWLAYDGEGNYEAMLDAQNTKVPTNVFALADAGKVFSVAGGTPGVVVRTAVFSALVRDDRGREGWIQKEELTPAP